MLTALFSPSASLRAQQQPLAATPPMGWNSWDSYGLTVTADEFKANVDWLHQHLQPHGWQYVVVDEGWYLDHPGEKGAAQGFHVSPDGRYEPAAGRFPSAQPDDGLKALADYAHAQGLKFGIHIIRGIPREAVDRNLPIANSSFHAADAANTADKCEWNGDNYGLKDNEAAQAYYDSIAKLYASWGVDFLKVDCISKPYQAAEIHRMAAALRKTGRPIVLSLSPGPTPVSEADDVRQYAQMWRISNDVWDVWSNEKDEPGQFPQSLSAQAGLLADWAPHIERGHWPDADMLPIGYLGPRPGWGDARASRFTPEETRTLLTLWSIARSPLVLGANLTKIDAKTEALLTNDEVIEVDQHSTGNHPAVSTKERALWVADLPKGRKALAAVNLTAAPVELHYSWKDLGLEKSSWRLRNLWEQKDVPGAQTEFHVTLGPHSSALYSLK
ncbi:glycoside hydrolase family 27 protein [Silvibacterium sp.]|uniref:glycoside hydrolase family 27 protein n=1 Tax=Silvibacterium sp. TaxID=1964179 RepID=UPI0039E4FC89